jgi:hypothetical protein
VGPPNAKRRPGGGGAAILTGNGNTAQRSPPAGPAQHLRLSQRFRRLTERLHRLGPRPCGEALLLVAEGCDLLEVLEEYARFDPEFVRWAGARDWPPAMWRVA